MGPPLVCGSPCSSAGCSMPMPSAHTPKTSRVCMEPSFANRSVPCMRHGVFPQWAQWPLWISTVLDPPLLSVHPTSPEFPWIIFQVPCRKIISRSLSRRNPVFPKRTGHRRVSSLCLATVCTHSCFPALLLGHAGMSRTPVHIPAIAFSCLPF